MKVISWNILHGQPLPPPDPWLDEERSLELLRHSTGILAAAIGKGPFVLGIQEVDALQTRSAYLHQTEVIAEALGAGAEYWGFAPAIFGTPGEPWRSAKREPVKIFTHQTEAKVLQGAGPTYGDGLITNIPVKKWHRCELGKSRVGVNMKFPDGKGGRNTFYIKDENRVALIAELENGYTVAVTHLSFVPFVNLYQYWKLLIFMWRIPGKKIVMGDFNLPWNIPSKLSLRRSLKSEMTFPIWEPKVQIDYLLVPRLRSWARKLKVSPMEIPVLDLSDHLPHCVEINEA
jgi:endonuclease/exonuclease/phosphatase family metal-dependent hydrolase